MSRLTSIVKAQYTPSAERKEFVCQTCGAEWTQLEVLSSVGPEGFECQRCSAVLSTADEVDGGNGTDRTGHEKNSKLMAQLDAVLKLLKQIDSVDIPPNDFETAWEHKIDIIRNQSIHPNRPAMAVTKNRQVVRGMSKTDASTLEVSLTSSAEKSAAEQAQQDARKAALEKQNALPVWHTQSTVTTDARNVPTVKPEANGDTPTVDIKSEVKEEEKVDQENLNDTVAAYYAEMAREKEREEATSPDDFSEDDEEDEFEDVGVTPSGPATPAKSEMGNVTSTPHTNGTGLKRELDSESGSSAPHTNVGTPITPAEEGPAAKKVKVEPDIKKEDEAEGSDEDEEEFEDV